MSIQNSSEMTVPWFGARKLARSLLIEVAALRDEREALRRQLEALGAMSVVELQEKKRELENDLAAQRSAMLDERRLEEAAIDVLKLQVADLRKAIVETEDLALLQEAGVYKYRHPLSDAVAYEKRLDEISGKIKEMTKKDGGAVLATTNWTVSGSAVEGRKMVRDFSKLMLRAFNAEADNLVRGLKPYKVDAAIERLDKVSETIERLGKTMQIRISPSYVQLRRQELELTADFLEKQAEEKEAERLERERMREERKAQQELEREREKLEKEKRHYQNALRALEAKGDAEAVARMQAQLADVDKAIEDVDYRAANIRAGYVYVISNIGSFGERMVKVGMTRRLDPVDRIRELSDASVPFNFDVHCLFFSKDAVSIESAMHERLAASRVNVVNRRREFFRSSPLEVKTHLSELAGDVLEYTDVPEALEYRQCVAQLNAREQLPSV
jgi:hypothetical protein